MLKSVHNREQREKKQRDPEGRMSLRDHLRELRNRLAIAVIAIVVFTGAALPFAREIIEVIVAPLPRCIDDFGDGQDGCAWLTYDGLTSAFTTHVKVALLAGVIAGSPVWLYQLWAFIAPGLHRNEKRYTRSVVIVGVPLFLFGIYFAYMLLPRAIPILLGFAAADAENLSSVPQVIDFALKLAIAFGLAFELPLILVLLNFGGAVSGRRMLGWWRGMIMGIALFAAMVTPTDPMSMIALAVPVSALYFLATGISLLNDLRRRRRDPEAGLSDDEASDLDLTPSPISGPEGIGRQRDGDDGDDPPRRNGYDDAT